MPLDILINLIFLLLLALLLWLFYAQNKSSNEQLQGCLRMIDEQIKMIYKLEKRMLELENHKIDEQKLLDNTMQNCEILINSMMDERVDELRNGNFRLAAEVDNYAAYSNDLEERIATLESFQAPASRILAGDEDDRARILELADSGLSTEQIAIRLKKSPQAINIILKSARGFNAN